MGLILGEKCMEDLLLSVVIPTYNRKDILEKCLQSLFNQTYSLSNCEIIVVDDGSTDTTNEVIKSVSNNSLCAVKYFTQEKKGPAAARNVGIRNAEGEIILLLGDDILASKHLLEEHMKFHESEGENVAILGHIQWSLKLRLTPFLKYLEDGNIQFAYSLIKDPNNLRYNYFYASNTSLKKAFLLKNGLFDEGFPYAAYEDTELGYRLQKKGLIIKYNKNAVAYHYHPINLNKYCERMRLVGISMVIISKKHPEISLLKDTRSSTIKEGLKAYIYPLLRFFLSFLDQYLGIHFPALSGRVIFYYSEKGMRSAIARMDLR